MALGFESEEVVIVVDPDVVEGGDQFFIRLTTVGLYVVIPSLRYSPNRLRFAALKYSFVPIADINTVVSVVENDFANGTVGSILESDTYRLVLMA